MFLKFVLCCECQTVNAGELRILFVSSPVGACYMRKFESFWFNVFDLFDMVKGLWRFLASCSRLVWRELKWQWPTPRAVILPFLETFRRLAYDLLVFITVK